MPSDPVPSVRPPAVRVRPRALPNAPRDRLCGLVAMARHPALRPARPILGPGAELIIAPTAELRLAPGLVSRRDLTLSVLGHLEIGRGLFCNRGVMISVMHDVRIGDEVRFGERVSVIDHDHVIEPLADHEARFAEYLARPIEIGNRVLVGAGAVILAGARIGDDAVIGAGAVVTGEIPAGTLALGAPARVRRALG